jgi:hypothetical protein
MQHALMLARIETLREEIKLIQNQQRFYRTVKRGSFEQDTENIRLEIRLLELQAELVCKDGGGASDGCARRVGFAAFFGRCAE